MDSLESRRLLALAVTSGVSTITGADYQSIDQTVPIPGGTVTAGTFGPNTSFGNGLSATPRGATDIFLSVVKGNSASLLAIGGGDDRDDGKLKFEDDRADYAGAPERVEDTEFFFPASARAGRADEYVTKMALGPDGKLYVAIAFRRTISLDTNAKRASTLTAVKEFDNEYFDSAVLRYTIDGTSLKLDRTLQIGGTFNDIIYDIGFAADGDLIVAGSFERLCDFQPGTGTKILNPAGRGDAFVARYGSKNKLEWVRQFGSDTSDDHELEAALSLAVSGDNVYVGGIFAGDAEFDRRDTLDADGQSDGDERVRLEAKDGTDGFTLKLGADRGSFEWVRGQGGDDYDGVTDLALAPDGGVYNVGYFQNEADLDSDIDDERNFEAAEDEVDDGRAEDTDAFFTRIDADGDQVWVKPLAGTGHELIASISSTANGELTIAGSYAGELDLDPTNRRNVIESAEADIDDRNGDRDHAYAGFIAAYSAKGTYRRVARIDGQREQDVFIIDVAQNSNGYAISGRYRGGFTLSSSSSDNVLPNRVTTQKRPSGRDDGFAIRYPFTV